MLILSVFASVLWLAETWLLTKQQRNHLDSWGARLAARTARIRRGSLEDIGQYWRRLHRTGRNLLERMGAKLDGSRAKRVHTFAGHLARTPCSLLRAALRSRCLAWWRYRQARHRSKHEGLHPKRFKAWRWESQMTDFFGEAEAEDPFSNVGWMLQAQERKTWKRTLDSYLSSL